MHRILFHEDSDGFAAAGVVYKHLMQNHKDAYIYFHPINYGMPIPPEIDYDNDYVYMVDFSLQPLNTMELFAAKLGDRLVWVDHHKSSVDMEEESEILKEVSGFRRVNFKVKGNIPISGCELAWEYFFSGSNASSMPIILMLIGDWDTWRWQGFPPEEQDTVQALQYYLRHVTSNPKTKEGREFWLKMLRGAEIIPSQVLILGKVLLEYQRKAWRSLVGGRGFTADFQGHRAVMVNQQGNSEMFKGFFDPKQHDIMVTFQEVQGRYVTVSMYTPKVNKIHLGNLAKKLGEAGDKPSGGGHAGAAGFQCSMDYFKTLYDVTGDFNPKK